MINIRDIGAEFFLNYMYPDYRKEWTVVTRGAFYRNYSDDILSLDADKKYVELSRDSFLTLLPDVLLSPEDEKGQNEVKHRRLQLLQEAFAPIDSFQFRAGIKAEGKISELLDGMLHNILLNYFDYDIDAETNEYCRKVAPLLPYTSRLRGDIHFIRKLLSSLTGCKVNIRQTAWSDTDNSKCWMPKTYFDIVMEGLSPQQYCEEAARLQPLTDMITERFMPFDSIIEIGIKGHSDTNSIINYNTRTREL